MQSQHMVEVLAELSTNRSHQGVCDIVRLCHSMDLVLTVKQASQVHEPTPLTVSEWMRLGSTEELYDVVQRFELLSVQTDANPKGFRSASLDLVNACAAFTGVSTERWQLGDMPVGVPASFGEVRGYMEAAQAEYLQRGLDTFTARLLTQAYASNCLLRSGVLGHGLAGVVLMTSATPKEAEGTMQLIIRAKQVYQEADVIAKEILTLGTVSEELSVQTGQRLAGRMYVERGQLSEALNISAKTANSRILEGLCSTTRMRPIRRLRSFMPSLGQVHGATVVYFQDSALHCLQVEPWQMTNAEEFLAELRERSLRVYTTTRRSTIRAVANENKANLTTVK